MHIFMDSTRRRLRPPFVEIVGCIESDTEACCKATAKLGNEFSSQTYESFLKSDIDIVAIGIAYGDGTLHSAGG